MFSACTASHVASATKLSHLLVLHTSPAPPCRSWLEWQVHQVRQCGGPGLCRGRAVRGRPPVCPPEVPAAHRCVPGRARQGQGVHAGHLLSTPGQHAAQTTSLRSRLLPPRVCGSCPGHMLCRRDPQRAHGQHNPGRLHQGEGTAHKQQLALLHKSRAWNVVSTCLRACRLKDWIPAMDTLMAPAPFSQTQQVQCCT